MERFFEKNPDRINETENIPIILNPPERLLDGFHTTKWSGLSFDERLSLLQSEENSLAKAQGRAACAVRPASSKEIGLGAAGKWSAKDNAIYVNESLLRNGEGPVNANVVLCDTVAHEGFHAYQAQAAKNPSLSRNPEAARLWALNSDRSSVDAKDQNYIPKEENAAKNRIQPLEKDAFDYSEANTKKVFENARQRLGPDSGYDKYLADCKDNSYESALSKAKAQYPDVEKTMISEMEQNSKRYEDERQILNLQNGARQGMDASRTAGIQIRTASQEKDRGYTL